MGNKQVVCKYFRITCIKIKTLHKYEAMIKHLCVKIGGKKEMQKIYGANYYQELNHLKTSTSFVSAKSLLKCNSKRIHSCSLEIITN
jgi:hypothetical protein